MATAVNNGSSTISVTIGGVVVRAPNVQPHDGAKFVVSGYGSVNLSQGAEVVIGGRVAKGARLTHASYISAREGRFEAQFACGFPFTSDEWEDITGDPIWSTDPFQHGYQRGLRDGRAGK